MRLALVVSTLGRIEPLRRLIASVAPQLAEGDELVLVAQARHDEVLALVDGVVSAGRIRVIRSQRGASLGRNAGVDAVTAADPLLLFPNDTSWFPEGALAAIRAFPDGVTAGALTVVDPGGPKFVLPAAGAPLDRRTVWAVIEMGLLVRRSAFEALGGFDPAIGTGASTPWQAGEATDLLLRLRRAGLHEGFVWMPPSTWIGGVAEAEGLAAPERRRKLRRYGRGIGRLVVRHRYPAPWIAAFVAAGLLFGVRNATYRPLDGLWAFVGRFEGVTGRLLGGTRELTAVSR